MTYECTVMGDFRGATIWIGTALNCPLDEIVLVHSHFINHNTIIRSCNYGATVAQGLYALNNNYTSQLNVTATRDIDGTPITCAYDDGISDRNIGQFLIQLAGII